MATQVVNLAEVESFKEQVDVLVVGYGIAGACAALEARRLGGDVLVLERASAGGGASALSSGLFYLGGGTPVQKACGFEDSPENMYRFMIANMGSENADLAYRYCQDNVAHFEWLEAQGVPFERSYHKGKAVFLLSTEGLLSTGNENVWPYRDIAKPVPRGHQVAAEGDSPGSAAMEALIKRCAEEGVKVACDTHVVALIADDSGRICGVKVRQQGREAAYRANKGVVIATGSFAMNPDMVKEYLTELGETSDPLGMQYNDGSGINMGVAAGAATEAMNGVIATASIYPPEQLIKGIIVNKFGERFVAEDSYHGRTAAFISEQPDQRAFLIVDSEIFAYPEIVTARHELVDGFETVEEMEQGLGMPENSLTKTIREYNEHAKNGEDPVLFKHPDWVKPLDQGPWAAFDISFNRSFYYFIPLGGLKINVHGEVVDPQGNPIPGLFAAGACTAHIPQSGKSYASGMSLGPGSYFGRVAGRAIMGVKDQ